MIQNKDANKQEIWQPSHLREVLGRHGFTFKKQFGQNFLIDKQILDKIAGAAAIEADDGVFEIGPGAGVLTGLLASRAKRVVAVEKDRTLRPVLDEILSNYANVDVIYSDVLDLNLVHEWQRFNDCSSVSVVANLPYYVTTPILFHLLDAKVPIKDIIVMVQREVADRLAANPGGKDYGALTVAVQYRAQVDKVTLVHKGAFLPPPTVESTVVRLRCRQRPPAEVLDEALFSSVVRAAFGARRKTLANALSARFGIEKDDCKRLLLELNIDPVRRGETLSIAEFAKIANLFAERRQDAPGSKNL